MPFTDKEGKIVKVTNTVNIYYQLLFTRSPGEENDGLVETTPTTWKKEYLSLALTRAGSNKNLYLNIANSYTGLIDNAKKLLATFQNDIEGDGDDMEYMNSVLPVISQYDSLLTDYDSAARETGALGALQNYVELRDQTENEAELTDLRKTAMDSQRNARNTWKINLEKIRDSDQTPPDEKAKAKTKVEIIDKTLILVEASLKNTLTSHFDELKETFGIEEKSDINKMNIDRVLDLISKMPSIDFLQEVKSIGTATAESLTITTITEGVTTSKPFNVDKIDSELTEREGKISTHQSEITDAIGEFLPTKETVAGSRDENVESRKTLGVKVATMNGKNIITIAFNWPTPLT